MHHKFLFFSALIALFLFQGLFLGVPDSAAQANVTIAPTRLVFEGRERSAELVLINRGTSPVTYRIGLVGMHMNERGGMVQIEAPMEGQHFAHDLLRFAPRQIRLEPGVAQRVRVTVRKPADLADGEYRSHMLFQAVPEASPEPEALEEGQLAIRLNIISGLSIAVIVRHGELDAATAISDLALVAATEDNPQPHLAFQLQREGNRSIYGQLTASFIADGSDEEISIARARGAAVYTPNAFRQMQLALTPPDDLALENGRIIVTYRKSSEAGGEVLATQELRLP